MADGIVGLAADGTGKKVDTSELTVGANLVERQRVQLAGNLAGQLVGVRGDGFLQTKMDPTTLMFDTFETLNTTDVWTIGGTVAPSGASGVLSVAPGAAVGASSYAQSKPTFIPGASAYLQPAILVQLEAGTVTNNKRVWGLGLFATTPTIAVPLSNGIVFEVDGTGTLFGAVYSNGSRTLSVTLTRPTDAATHRYQIAAKASRAYFEIDGVEVGQIPFPNTSVAALAMVIGSFNDAATAPSAAPVLNSTLMGTADTGRNNTQISDGTFGWRKAQVGKSGGLSVKGASITPTSLLFPAGATNTIGPVDVSEAGNATFTVKNAAVNFAYGGSPVIVFEQSDDNLHWGPLLVVRSDTGAAITTVTLPANTGAGSLMFDCSLEGVNWIRARVTSPATTNDMRIIISPGGLAFMPSISVIQQPIAKGVQGVSGVTTQDLKDAGRVAKIINNDSVTIGSTSETSVSFNVSTDNGAQSFVSAYTVTAGKRLRIQQISATLYTISGNTTAAAVALRLRGSPSGTTASSTSPVQLPFSLPGVAAANAAGTPVNIPIPDGWEFGPGSSFAITATCAGYVATTAAPRIYLSIIGYEY